MGSDFAPAGPERNLYFPESLLDFAAVAKMPLKTLRGGQNIRNGYYFPFRLIQTEPAPGKCVDNGMAGIVPNYLKKIQILKGREEKLRKLLAQSASEAKLLKAAEIVRDARIRAEQAKREKLSPEDTPELRKAIARINAKITAIRETAPVEVLAEYRRRR